MTSWIKPLILTGFFVMDIGMSVVFIFYIPGGKQKILNI